MQIHQVPFPDAHKVGQRKVSSPERVHIHLSAVCSIRALETTSSNPREWCSVAHPTTIHHPLKPGLESAAPQHRELKVGTVWLPRGKSQWCYPRASIQPRIIAASDTPASLPLCLVWHLAHSRFGLNGDLTLCRSMGITEHLAVAGAQDFRLFSHLMSFVLGPHTAFHHGLNNHSSLRDEWGILSLTHICLAADMQATRLPCDEDPGSCEPLACIGGALGWKGCS